MESQPSTQTDVPQIFKKPTGEQLKVFLQAEEVYSRSRIAKHLKKRGAVIEVDPKNADAVLVNDETDGGRMFVRVWSMDSTKVVLRCQWVEACVEAGRMLGPDDGWGGFLTQSDGRSIDDDLSETEQKSPLPTPRQTKSPARPTKTKSPTTHVDNAQKAAARPSLPPAAAPTGNTSAREVDSDGDEYMTPEQIANLSPEVLMALGDVLERTASPHLQAQAQHIRGFATRHSSTSSSDVIMDEDIEMGPPSYPRHSVSAKALGKKREVSVSSRGSSLSVPPQSPMSPSTSSAPRDLFVKRGTPVKFFVQFVPRRKVFVNAIKKHGGEIVADPQGADVAVLFETVLANIKDYKNLKMTAENCNVPVVQSSFIDDCIEAGKLLSFDRKRRHIAVARDDSESDSSSDEPIAHKSKSKKQKVAERAASPPSPPKKAPQPVKTPQVKKSQGKISQKKALEMESPKAKPTSGRKPFARYTEEQMTKALEIVYEIYRDNADESWARVCKVLNEKLPGHTERSWNTHTMQGNRKHDFEDARKRGAIQYRKRQAQLEHKQSVSREQSTVNAAPPSRKPSISYTNVPSSEASPMPTTPVQAESVPATSHVAAPAPVPVTTPAPVPTPAAPTPAPPLPVAQPIHTLEEDIERFANFLAFEGGDSFDTGADPMAAYAALHELAPWRTAQGWYDFWGAHWQPIQALYDSKAGTE